MSRLPAFFYEPTRKPACRHGISPTGLQPGKSKNIKNRLRHHLQCNSKRCNHVFYNTTVEENVFLFLLGCAVKPKAAIGFRQRND
jgi:hypothetical protein